MKKSIIILAVLLLAIQFASAVEFDMKSEFSQGETIIARVSGNFIDPVLRENIHFYRGNVPTSIIYDVARISGEFYIYAILSGKKEGNYSIVIENAKYMKGSQVVEDAITKNFSITNSTADFSVDPGFIITKGKFFVQVQNLKDYKINVNAKILADSGNNGGGLFDSLFGNNGETNVYEKSVALKSGEIKKIDFELANLTGSELTTLEVSSENLKYSIPLYIITNMTGEEGEKEKGIKLKFDPSELNVSIPTSSNTTRIIYLRNSGEVAIENISLSVSDSLKDYLSLSAYDINGLEGNSSVKIEVYLSSGDIERTFEGQITAKAPSAAEGNDVYAYAAVFLNFVKGFKPLDNETGEINYGKENTCSEMNGEICAENMECYGDLKYALDGVCCLGSCRELKESPTGKIIGWLIIVLVAVFLIWFFRFKYKEAKKEVNLLKIAKRK